jgi:hypothetical protein
MKVPAGMEIIAPKSGFSTVVRGAAGVVADGVLASSDVAGTRCGSYLPDLAIITTATVAAAMHPIVIGTNDQELRLVMGLGGGLVGTAVDAIGRGGTSLRSTRRPTTGPIILAAPPQPDPTVLQPPGL